MLNAVAKARDCCLPQFDTPCAKAILVALSIICIIAGVVSTGCFYTSMGPYAFGFLIEGTILALVPLVILACRAPCLERKITRPTIILEGDELPAVERWSKLKGQYGMSDYTVIEPTIRKFAAENSFEIEYERSMGALLGMVIGDTFGLAFSHLPFKPEGYMQEDLNKNLTFEQGQWSADSSLTLCLADTLIQGKGKLDVGQLVWAFYDYMHYGYNSAFTLDNYLPPAPVRGEIAKAVWYTPRTRDTQADNLPTDVKSQISNGSLIRTAPVALVAKSADEAMKMAYRQSKATDSSDEVAACCQLIAYVIYQLIHEGDAKLDRFKCKNKKVQALATDKKWLEAEFAFQFSEDGSNCFDALGWALHCVFSTDSFLAAVAKAATHGGEAHALGSLTGQIAGARFGRENIPEQVVAPVQLWDRGGDITARALLLQTIASGQTLAIKLK